MTLLLNGTDGGGDWSSTICSDCLVGPSPEPWKSDLNNQGELWDRPLGCLEQACPCGPIADNYEMLGMLDDGSLPCTMSNTQCCWASCVFCILGNIGLPVLPFYMAKMRIRAADVLELKQDSYCLNVGYGCAAGLVANQVSRELILKGKNPRTKVVPGIPASQDMDR
jgi:hypothetical protein